MLHYSIHWESLLFVNSNVTCTVGIFCYGFSCQYSMWHNLEVFIPILIYQSVLQAVQIYGEYNLLINMKLSNLKEVKIDLEGDLFLFCFSGLLGRTKRWTHHLPWTHFHVKDTVQGGHRSHRYLCIQNLRVSGVEKTWWIVN